MVMWPQIRPYEDACALDAPAKRATAMSLARDGRRTPGGTAVSVQVLQELHVNIVRRGRTPEEAARVVSDFGHWPVIENTRPLLVAAMQSHVDGRSLWGMP